MIFRLKLSVILFFTSVLFLALSCTSQSGEQNKQAPAAGEQIDEGESEIALIYRMSFINLYSQKLWFAGMQENWELADIYSHEIEEITDGIIRQNIIDDGINVSELMESMIAPQIELMEQAIDNRDSGQFENRFNTLIQTCNQCHTASNYGAVRITVPQTNPFNQDFTPADK
ncbi:hypothetical protein [Rhodohalobacter mucosus]|uniref:Cytochrome c domain-containing protein n=1 Tax=Rhodohalobacter mucosus TaxID=2079485 RepID=A0A316TXD1_9BACT|nr:hypothetical protein [Rhodohalobacter mucosus]PWN07302.1 hypothetical protein DDZ15_03270 [Rhodohalobacter mucosus]